MATSLVRSFTVRSSQMDHRRAWVGAALLAALSVPASAQTYSFKYTAASGAVLGTGTLTTDGVTYDASAFAGAGATGTAVTSMTGSFEGQALTYVAAPHPPQSVSDGGYSYGDGLLLNGSMLLDEGGLVVGTAGALGRGNLLGFADPQFGAAPYNWIFEHGPNVGFPGYLAVSPLVGAVVTMPGGSAASPAALPSGEISVIAGAIGPAALEQFYSFSWGGGAFSTTASVTGAAATDTFDLDLFGSGVNVLTRLDAADNFIGGLDIANLAAGRYTIGLSADVNVDPDFTIQFDAPIGSAVPEPSIWATLLLGLGLAGAALRRRRPSIAARAVA